jgi:ABC-type Mn2+/Zn2+ transport system permease subunit
MKLIGIMIVPAILILPALIADKMFNSIKKTIIFSITIAMFGIILGIFLSIFINVPASILISLILVFLFLIKLIKYSLQ